MAGSGPANATLLLLTVLRCESKSSVTLIVFGVVALSRFGFSRFVFSAARVETPSTAQILNALMRCEVEFFMELSFQVSWASPEACESPGVLGGIGFTNCFATCLIAFRAGYAT